MQIRLELDEVQAKALLTLINLAVQHVGIPAAEAGLTLTKLIDAAVVKAQAEEVSDG